jgi:nucleotide-binding universal stress UspA family protein
MKALVGVDGSSNSLAAAEFVGRALSSERDELILLYAAPEVSFSGEELLDAAVQQRARTAISKAVLDEAIARLNPAWQQRAQAVEVAGSPGAALLAAADEENVDLIAVGFRGTSLLERFMLGSVSRAVVHSAHVPVLVVKSEPVREGVDLEKPAGAGDRKLRVLIAYDGPAFGDRIATVLSLVEWPPITDGWVMTVVQPMFITELPDWLRSQPSRDPDVAAMAEAWKKEHEQNVAEARRELAAFQAKLPAAFRKQEPIVVEGRPAEQLLAQLNRQQFDLVVVGSRGRGNVARLLLGSTSSEVLASAPCSVLIVR